MTPGLPQSHRDLLSSALTAVLTTVDAKGRPPSTAVWYLLRGDDLIISITNSRQKYKNLRGDPRCTLFVVDPRNPFRTIEIRADAALAHDPDKSDTEAVALAYGADPASARSQPGERYTVTLRPDRVIVSPAG